MVLIVIGQHSAGAGSEQQAQIGLSEAATDGVVRVNVADLRGVPFFVKGAARNGVRKEHQKGNETVESSLKGRGKPVQIYNRYLTLLDWSGDVARQLGVSGSTDRAYHLFVISPSGSLLLHLKQGENGVSEEAARGQTLAVLRKSAVK